jgi:hypothetical protein
MGTKAVTSPFALPKLREADDDFVELAEVVAAGDELSLVELELAVLVVMAPDTEEDEEEAVLDALDIDCPGSEESATVTVV